VDNPFFDKKTRRLMILPMENIGSIKFLKKKLKKQQKNSKNLKKNRMKQSITF